MESVLPSHRADRDLLKEMLAARMLLLCIFSLLSSPGPVNMSLLTTTGGVI